MTPMTKEQMLTLAAKAMGFEVSHFCDANAYIKQPKVEGRFPTVKQWNPLESIADCGEMECELDIDVGWRDDDGADIVTAARWENCDYFLEHEANYKDHPTKQHARMYASTMVAALIGSKL